MSKQSTLSSFISGFENVPRYIIFNEEHGKARLNLNLEKFLIQDEFFLNESFLNQKLNNLEKKDHFKHYENDEDMLEDPSMEALDMDNENFLLSDKILLEPASPFKKSNKSRKSKKKSNSTSSPSLLKDINSSINLLKTSIGLNSLKDLKTGDKHKDRHISSIDNNSLFISLKNDKDRNRNSKKRKLADLEKKK